MRKAMFHHATPIVALAALVVGVLAGPASAQKVLHLPMSTDGPKTLDPVQGSTTYENRCCSQFYQTLLQYKYLKRPLELEPLLLETMPEISDDGLTWTFTLKQGIRFHDDACFPGGKGRELVASDVIYSWKRLADPKYQYKNWWLLEDQIKGLNEFRDAQKARADAGQPCDYNAPVEGLRVLDDHKFEVVLTEPVQQFMWKLAMFQLSVVPREAVEMYGTRFSGHPVGTGPFILADEGDWQRGSSIVFNRNPNYWDDRYPSEAMDGDKAAGLDKAAGTKLPIVDRVEVTFFVESQPMWLEFKAKNLDFTTMPEFGFEEAINRRDRELKRSWARDGTTLQKIPLLDFIFRAFNMEDPMLGGYTPEKKALRQAISLCMDWNETNEAYYNGTNVIYDGPIPPGLDGHPENHTAPVSYRGPDYERARQKLREAGYTIGADGKVTDLPPIDMFTDQSTTSTKMTELLQRQLSVIGIKLNPRYVDFSVLIENVNNKKAPMFSFAWGSDYPDAENNLALFYSKNMSPGSNHYNYNRPEYDAMYERIRTMPPGPERTEIYVRMRDMVIEDAPYAGSMARTRYYLVRPWLKNFKATEDFYNYFKYLDVDMDHPER